MLNNKIVKNVCIKNNILLLNKWYVSNMASVFFYCNLNTRFGC